MNFRHLYSCILNLLLWNCCQSRDLLINHSISNYFFVTHTLYCVMMPRRVAHTDNQLQIGLHQLLHNTFLMRVVISIKLTTNFCIMGTIVRNYNINTLTLLLYSYIDFVMLLPRSFITVFPKCTASNMWLVTVLHDKTGVEDEDWCAFRRAHPQLLSLL